MMPKPNVLLDQQYDASPPLAFFYQTVEIIKLGRHGRRSLYNLEWDHFSRNYTFRVCSYDILSGLYAWALCRYLHTPIICHYATSYGIHFAHLWNTSSKRTPESSIKELLCICGVIGVIAWLCTHLFGSIFRPLSI